MTRFWMLGGLLLGLTLGAMSLHVPGTRELSIRDNMWFVIIAGISLAVYLLAVWLVLHRPAPRHTVWVVLLVAAALRLPLIPVLPFLSSDVNRYVWDGMVQVDGINPYRYIPADPALVPLRDQAVYPHVNRAEYAPTIYPPAAQAIFAATALLWPSVTGVKIVMVGFEVLAVVCLLRLLAAARLPAERVLIYVWNPLPVWAFASDGHIDAATVGFVSLALLLRTRRRDGFAGIVMGAAIATKFLPAVVAPALWRRGARWRLAICCALTVAVLFALYSSVGWRMFGFLRGYGAEEGMTDGSGIWLLAGLARAVPLPAIAVPLYWTAVLGLLAGLAGWLAFIRRPDDPVALCGAAAILMAVVTFAISPHYPWYFAWLAVPAVLAPYRALVWLAASPILFYLDTFGDRFIWPSVVFVPTLLLALADLRPSCVAAPIKGNT
ncbi:glycosyltransferase 87 family protein [Rhodopila sp.]|uniref:glycosyltransferase 87 family protein n=1 Tax=Rhodopila sp. TaxID=2480087 RepID=UPI003D0A2416